MINSFDHSNKPDRFLLPGNCNRRDSKPITAISLTEPCQRTLYEKQNQL